MPTQRRLLKEGQPADPVQVGLSVPNEDPAADAERDAARFEDEGAPVVEDDEDVVVEAPLFGVESLAGGVDVEDDEKSKDE